MNSFEVLVQRNVFDRSRLFLSEKERLTVYSRAEALLLPDRTVGYALASLKEAFYGEHAHSLLFVEYDNLVKCPAQTLRLIYNFLDEKPYNHSFNAIEYDEPEFDASIATPGLHRIKESVRASPPLIVLPPDLCTMIEQLNFWRDAAESSSSSIIRCLYEDVKDVQDSNTKLVIERPIGTSSYPTTKKL